MARMAAVREQYARESVTTSQERLLTLLYDRLVRDLVAAEQAIGDEDREQANEEIAHAEAIILELLTCLDTSTWSAAMPLVGIYVWSLQRLIEANASQDASIVAETRGLLEPLAEAWHAAAAEVASTPLHLVKQSTIAGAM